ncbi:MAG: MFS transporter [Rhodoblastus sp.]|nr:MAG: MFS transporter [Rhodoblastus sp.]
MTASLTTAAQAADLPRAPLTTAERVKAILVGSMGNLIEWFDVYAFAAFQLYFAPSFFVGVEPAVQQFLASLVFALGFILRPLGGVVFGWLADKYGRRISLMMSVLLMCFGSGIIALTPTAYTIGVAAPIMLTLARVLQGISQGGEYGASATYLAEISEPHRRGFYSGVWYVTLIGGQVCAILLLLILQNVFLTDAQLKDWGWRIPFVIGALLAVYAMFMRKDMHETEHFHAAGATAKEHAPMREILKHWKALLLVVGVTIGGTSAFYTYTTYMQKFLKLSVKLTDQQTTMVTLASLLVALILQPTYGAISDKIGRKPLLIWFGVMGTLCTYPLLSTLQTTKSPFVAFLLIAAAWAIVSGYTSITAVIKAEMFPTSVRALGVGVPYALTVALFGGTVDSVAQFFKLQGHEDWFYWYATACIFISLCVYISLPDTKKTSKMEVHH